MRSWWFLLFFALNKVASAWLLGHGAHSQPKVRRGRIGPVRAKVYDDFQSSEMLVTGYLTLSFTYSLIYSLTYLLTYPLIYSIHSFTSLNRSFLPSFFPSFISYSLTHLLTQSLQNKQKIPIMPLLIA